MADARRIDPPPPPPPNIVLTLSYLEAQLIRHLVGHMTGSMRSPRAIGDSIFRALAIQAEVAVNRDIADAHVCAAGGNWTVTFKDFDTASPHHPANAG